MVITKPGQSVDELLAPFNEEIEVEPYVEETRQEIIDRIEREDREKLAEMKRCKEAGEECYVSIWKMDWEERGRRVPTDEDIAYAEKAVAEFDPDKAHAHYVELMSGDDLAMFDDEGNKVTTYNPKSKWDWYCEGGRWDGVMETKDGKHTNCCRIGDIAYEVDKDSEDYKRSLRWWNVVVDGAPLEEGENEEDFATFYRIEYLKDRYTDAEDYATRNCSFGTWAVLTSDGNWYEPGEMGWFDSDATPESQSDWERNFIQRWVIDQPDDYIATIVDCHI